MCICVLPVHVDLFVKTQTNVAEATSFEKAVVGVVIVVVGCGFCQSDCCRFDNNVGLPL